MDSGTEWVNGLGNFSYLRMKLRLYGKLLSPSIKQHFILVCSLLYGLA
jgi:hypothetical protein